MVEVAREWAPGLPWHVADLAVLDLGTVFDIVVCAGNVVPLVGDTVPAVVLRLARHVTAGGLLVAGFGLDAGHLPPGVPVVGLPAYDATCAAAGLALRDRYAGWDGRPYAGGGYAVSVHHVPTGGTAENRR